ncbi:MAG: response regulator transcription factor [Arcobacter sp.]|nr:response regulator transcription factor [Arcobacter sp.]
MDYELKDILKHSKVLFISDKESTTEKELEILNLFFNEIIFSKKEDKSLKIFSTQHPDIIITDIELNEINGIEFCKKIRKTNPKIPIIILSKNKSEQYLFEAIRLQVIDFIVKPIKIENLIFALNQTAKHIVNHGNLVIKINCDIKYDYKEKSVSHINGNFHKLTKNEFRLLELLLANKHRTIKKEEITKYLWANEYITESAFKSLFSRLRNKIGKDNIKNKFGIGYQLI